MGGSPYLLTAGHCDTAPGGGSEFYNGGLDGSAPIGNVPSQFELGANSGNLLTTSQHIDSQLIGTDPSDPNGSVLMATPDVWSGSTLGNAASSTALPVLGATTPPEGTSVCDDGAYEGLVCGAVVSPDFYDGCQVGSNGYSSCQLTRRYY